MTFVVAAILIIGYFLLMAVVLFSLFVSVGIDFNAVNKLKLLSCTKCGQQFGWDSALAADRSFQSRFKAIAKEFPADTLVAIGNGQWPVQCRHCNHQMIFERHRNVVRELEEYAESDDQNSPHGT